VSAFAGRFKRPVSVGQDAALIEVLNEATLDYFRAARREGAGNASDFERWADRVAKRSAAFLGALGADFSSRPRAVLPLATYSALCSRSGSTLTQSRYASGFDYMGALEAAVAGAQVAYDLASHASQYHASQKSSPQDAAKKVLSARQTFILSLASVFEACFSERMTSSPHAGESPFLRFVMKAFSIVVDRMPPTAEPVTQPNDGGDHAAAQLLKHASETKIADDVRTKVYAAYTSRRGKRPRRFKASR
jgi:hypothetical protein